MSMSVKMSFVIIIPKEMRDTERAWVKQLAEAGLGKENYQKKCHDKVCVIITS